MKTIRWHYLPIEDLATKIDPTKPLFADFETYNDSKYYKGKFYGKIRLTQFMQEGWDAAVILDMKFGINANKLDQLADIVYNNKIVGQNFAYDYATLQEHRNKFVRIDLNKYEDILILTRELNPLQRSDKMDGRFSLDETYKAILGFDPYSQIDADKKKMQKANWALSLSPDMLNYSAIDVFYLPDLYNALKDLERQMLDDITEMQQQAYRYRVYNAHHAVLMGLMMQDAGLYLDIDKATKYVQDYQAKLKDAEKRLREQGVPSTLNYKSPNQILKLIPTLIDKNGKPSTNKETLKYAIHRDGNTTVQAIMDARQASSRIATVQKWFDMTRDYGRITGHFSPTTTTGRFSSSQENMQNQPRDSKVCFRAPDGAVMIGFDYAQIELRTMCALVGESAMYEIFKSNGDIHTNTQTMCNLSIRNVAKQVNFGNLYGMGANKFQDLLIKDDVYMELEVIQNIQRLFYSTYPRIPQFHQEGVVKSEQGVPNYSLLGHPYFSKFFNQMNNLVNQASGTSEVAKAYFRLADEIGLCYSDTCRLALQIHDSNLFYYWGKLEYLDHYAFAIGLLAQKAWFTVLGIGYTNNTSQYYDVPMPVEVGVSDNWKSVDDNIIKEIEGSYYLNNQEEADAWLEQFKQLHRQNIRQSLLNG